MSSVLEKAKMVPWDMAEVWIAIALTKYRGLAT